MSDPTTSAPDAHTPAAPAFPERSRLHGLGVLALGLLLAGINEYTLYSDGSFYPKITIFAGAVLGLGLFGLAVGLPKARVLEGQPMPYKAGYVTSMVVGLAAGLGYAVHLGFGI